MVIWIMPILKQFSTKYFFFFFILGINDIWVEVVYYMFGLRYSFTHCFTFSVLFLFFVYNRTSNTKFAFTLILNLILLTSSFYLKLVELDGGILMMLFLSFLYFLLSDFWNQALTNYKINIPLLILILYQLLNTLKVLNLMLYNYTAEFYFYTASAFQIIIGLFFSFVKIDDDRFAINLKHKSLHF